MASEYSGKDVAPMANMTTMAPKPVPVERPMTEAPVATLAQIAMIPRREYRSDNAPIGSWKIIEPISAEDKKSEICALLMPISAAYTGPNAKRAPAAAPEKNIVKTPVGTMENSTRNGNLPTCGSGGALASESAIGTRAIDTSADAMTKSSKLFGSATFKRN